MFSTTKRRVLLATRRTRAQAPSLWIAIGHPQAHLSGVKSVTTNAPIPRKTKVWDSAEEAVKDIKDGDVILSGGARAISHDAASLCESSSLAD